MSYTVYLVKPSNWTCAYVYAYSSSDVNIKNAEWHGVQMTDLGNGLYSYNIPDSLGSSPYVVFNDNGNSQFPQTGCLQVTSNNMILNVTDWSTYSTSTPSTITVATTTVSTTTVYDNSNVVQAINYNSALLYILIVMLGIVACWYFFYHLLKKFI